MTRLRTKVIPPTFLRSRFLMVAGSLWTVSGIEHKREPQAEGTLRVNRGQEGLSPTDSPRSLRGGGRART